MKKFPVRELTPEHGTHFQEVMFASHRQRYKGRAVMRIRSSEIYKMEQ